MVKEGSLKYVTFEGNSNRIYNGSKSRARKGKHSYWKKQHLSSPKTKRSRTHLGNSTIQLIE